MKNKRIMVGLAFLVGTIVSSGSVFASTNSIPATITIKEDTLAAAISPTSLSFEPQIGSISTEEIQIENTGEVAFYPSVEFTNFSKGEQVEERGIPLNQSSRLLFKAGSHQLDLDVPVVYPRGKQAVMVGETYSIPLVVGAGSHIQQGSNMNITFDVEVTLDKVMETVENLKATVDATNVHLTWDPFNVEGVGASQYRIRAYKYNPDTKQYERYLSVQVSPTNSYTCTGLDAGSDYRFEVTPLVNGYYRTKSLSSVEINVPNEAIDSGDMIEAPATNIQNLKATIGGTDVTLTWDSFSYEGQSAGKYRVKSYVFDEVSNQYEIYQTNKTTYDTSYTFTGLERGRKYQFEIIPQIGSYRDDLSSAIEVDIPN